MNEYIKIQALAADGFPMVGINIPRAILDKKLLTPSQLNRKVERKVDDFLVKEALKIIEKESIIKEKAKEVKEKK